MRPSQFQKWVKKYNGSADPYDHLATFRQVVRAEQITDLHTQVEGFGLTLEGKALSWFQTLEPDTFREFEALENDFIAAFSKMGIKHNVVAQIYGFVQKENESVRDCANRLRQYIARCPEGEMPSSQRLVSIFLEGLSNKLLHANLYAKKHNTLNSCIKDAIDFDDNCEIFGNVNASARSETSSTKNTIETGKGQPIDAEAIAEMVMKKMNQVFRPPQRQAEPPRFARQYNCGNCGGDHPTSQCLPKQGNPNQAAPRTDKWCDFEQKWTNHETHECYHRIRYLRNQGIAQQPAGPQVQ